MIVETIAYVISWVAFPLLILPLARWVGREDRFFPFEFQHRVAHERLATEARPVPGGHLAALSQPDAVARAVLAER